MDIDGNRIKLGKRAEATAEYLEKKQWGNTNNTPAKANPQRIHNERIKIDKDNIKIKELEAAIKKNSKRIKRLGQT